MVLASGAGGTRIVSGTFSVSHRPAGQVVFARRFARTYAVSGKSLVPYRQRSAKISSAVSTALREDELVVGDAGTERCGYGDLQ